jgi:uncharacterized protein YeaO (DUF488 family)
MKRYRIGLARAYDPPGDDDGVRVLVDRVWPRGIAKDELHIDDWLRNVAPSTELRKWFGHDPQRWATFVERYRAELDDEAQAWQPLADLAKRGKLTLIYGARDREHNQVVVLRDYLLEKLADH